MEFTGVHKEDLVKLLKNLKNDHHLIQGMMLLMISKCLQVSVSTLYSSVSMLDRQLKSCQLIS